MKKVVKMAGKIILTDSYQENIIELIAGLRHMGIQNMLENSLRASSGKTIMRPLGGSQKMAALRIITFIPAQTSPFPVDGEQEVDIKSHHWSKSKKTNANGCTADY